MYCIFDKKTMQENKYYIYAHKRLDNGNVFYIGKGSGNRAYIKSNRSNYWKRIVEKHGYEVVFLKTDLGEVEAYNFEISFIATYKENNECSANFTIGGDGVRVDKRWWNEKISKSLTGIKRGHGKDNKSFKDVVSKENLFEMYVEKNMTTTQISKLIGVSIPTVCSRLEMYSILKNTSGRKKTSIICLNDNKKYSSIMEAARFYGLHRENISKVLKGIYKNTGGLTFKKTNND